MRLSGLRVSLGALVAASFGNAQYLINELSFGYSGRVSPAETPGRISNFVVTGQPNVPEILSTKVVLTPMAPGNARGAIWAENPLQHSNFVADIDFRANGPERAGGNINIWLARNGRSDIGTKSVYNAGKFEGLVLVADQHGGNGMLRGFLNDGSTDYSQHHNVDQLAFGHCPYGYRNLGRPSQIKMRQTMDNFRVEIDGQLCFETNKFSLPTGYHLGITASTPDNPDSFEIFKTVVMSESPKSNAKSNDDSSRQQQDHGSNHDSNNNQHQQSNPGDFGDVADQDAEIFQTSKAQFQDLHNRLQNTAHQLSSVYRGVFQHQQADDKRHNEIKDILASLQSKVSRLDQVGELLQRINSLESEVRTLRNEIHQKINDNERTVRGVLSSHHDSLTRKLVDAVPGHGRLIAVIVGTQVVLVLAYVVYKRRRANSPKKYL